MRMRRLGIFIGGVKTMSLRQSLQLSLDQLHVCCCSGDLWASTKSLWPTSLKP